MALEGGEWSASLTGCFTHSERVSHTHWSQSGCSGEQKNLLLLGIKPIFLGHPAYSLVTILTNDDDDDDDDDTNHPG
jgi:hypothetical protein